MASNQAFHVLEEYKNKNVVITTDKGQTQTRIILNTSMTDQEIRNAVGAGVPLLHFGGDLERLGRFAVTQKNLKKKLKPSVKATLLPPKDGIKPVAAKAKVIEVSADNKAKMLAFDLAMNAGLTNEEALAKAKELVALPIDELESEKDFLKKALNVKKWDAKKVFNKIQGK